MGNLATPIAESLKFTDFIMNLVTGDLTDALATRRARDDEGASIAWVIGHLSHYRYEIMKLLGHEMESPFAEQFGTTGATDGAGYPSVEELRSTWADLSTRVRSVVEDASDEQIMKPLGGDGSTHGEKKVLDTLVFYMWHESYHMGQLGTLRAQFGLTPTATLAVKASQ